MCELRVFCKKFYGMICKRDKDGLKCLKVRGDNGKLIDLQLNRDDLEKIREINDVSLDPHISTIKT